MEEVMTTLRTVQTELYDQTKIILKSEENVTGNGTLNISRLFEEESTAGL